MKGGPHEIICHHQWLTLGACVIMWWASFIIAIVIIIIIAIIMLIMQLQGTFSDWEASLWVAPDWWWVSWWRWSWWLKNAQIRHSLANLLNHKGKTLTSTSSSSSWATRTTYWGALWIFCKYSVCCWSNITIMRCSRSVIILMERCVLHAVFAQQMQSSSRQPAL